MSDTNNKVNIIANKKRFFSKIRKFKIMLLRYLLVIKWILTDGLLKYKFRVIATILAGSASGFLQAVAVGQAIYYAKILEEGKVLNILGYRLDPRTSVVFLLILFLTIFKNRCVDQMSA